MDFLAPLKGFDRLQRRTKPLAIAIAVLRNFSDQAAGNAAALVAFWGFFSLFPLLLVFTAVLGFVLQGDVAAQQSVVHSTLREFPIVGSSLSHLGGSKVGLGIGIAGTLLSGLGVTSAVQNAFNVVYMIPHRDQPNFLIRRWRGLKLLAVVGVLQVLSTVAAGLGGAGFGGTLPTLATIAVSLLLNLLLFFVVFRFLIPTIVATRELWPGIALATVGWTVLQAVGGLYINHVVKGDGQTYGTFATIIGFLTWLYLGARIVVYAAEINVVLTRHLWPRSIMDPPEPADRHARAALAKMEERDDKETVEVAFHPPDPRRDSRLDEHPPYRVAPDPQRGEHARPVHPHVAATDVAKLTAPQLLDAIRDQLERGGDDPEATQQALAWIDNTETLLARDDRRQLADRAAAALALAAADALGLAEG